MVLRRRLAFTTGLLMMRAVAYTSRTGAGRECVCAWRNWLLCSCEKLGTGVPMDLPNKVKAGLFRQKFAKLPVLPLFCNESPYSPHQRNLRPLHKSPTTELAPCLCYTTGIRYPTHKIADGAIPTSYMRPTWTPYFWCKHLEKIARTVLNDTKYK